MSVYFDKKRKKWYFVVRIDGKQYKRYKTLDGDTLGGTGSRYDNNREKMLLEQERFVKKMKNRVNMLFKDFVEVYFEHLQIREQTLMTKRTIFNNAILPYLKDKTVDEITSQDIDSLIYMKLKDKSAAYKRNTFAQLKAIFNYAHRLHGIENPLNRVDTPKYIREEDHTFFNNDEFDDFFKILSSKKRKKYEYYYPLFMTLYTTGVRISEALALTTADVFKRQNINFIRVDKTLVSNIRERVQNHTKNSKTRDIAITKELFDILQKHIKEQHIAENERIFAKTPSSTLSFLRHFCKRHDLKEVNLHSFRHAHISKLILNGMNPLEVAYRVGDSIKTVMNIYAHYDKNFKKMAEKIEELYSKKQKSSREFKEENGIIKFFELPQMLLDEQN